MIPAMILRKMDLTYILFDSCISISICSDTLLGNRVPIRVVRTGTSKTKVDGSQGLYLIKKKA